ncbi:hypothetical protein AWENTII_005254 [Aspergillus wentii]
MGIELTRLDLQSSMDYFQPISLQTLEGHPLRPWSTRAGDGDVPDSVKIREYDQSIVERISKSSPLTERIAWTPHACVHRITSIFDEHLNHLARMNIPPETGYSLNDLTKWACISEPHNLADIYVCPPGFQRTKHPVRMVFGDEDEVLSHIMILMEH